MGDYVMTPTAPVRPFAIAAVVDLIGAAALVFGIDRDITALIVIGAVLFAVGSVLLIAAVTLLQRVRTAVRTDDDGIEIRSGGRTANARWQEITKVTADQRMIYLERSDNRPPLQIQSPRGGEDPVLKDIADELTTRLDQNRGYRPLQ